MVVSEATRAQTRRGKAPAGNTSTPPEVQNASESSRANPQSASLRPPKREAYITVDTLKNFMSVMTKSVTRQVLEQVKWAMEATNSARPLPHFDYVPTVGCEPSHWQTQVLSPQSTERERGTSWSNQGGRPHSEHHD